MAKYMILEIDRSSIYIREEIMGVEVASTRLNSVTKSTYIDFFQFFNDRYRSMPIVVKNEKAYLATFKGLITDKNPIKAEIKKIGSTHLVVDMSTRVDSLMMRSSKESSVISDVRVILEGI